MKAAFIGPSYALNSVNAATQRTLNMYLEKLEVPDEKSQMILKGTPGLVPFCLLPIEAIRCEFTEPSSGRLFVIANSTLFEVFANGTYAIQGTLNTLTGLCDIESNSFQLGIVDGPNYYIFTLATNVFQQINLSAPGFTGASQIAFMDGYFILLQPNSKEFFISALYDGTTLNALEYASKEGYSDYVNTLVCDHRELYLLGRQTIESWYDSGAANFPFQPIQGIFLQQGCVATYSARSYDNTIAWVGQDENGAGVCYKIMGYVPVRFSNFFVEQLLQSVTFAQLQQAVAYVYQANGHEFYVLNVPGLNTTLVHDASTQEWHERQYYNPATEMLEPHRAWFHAYAFGKHIVGDYQNGQLYYFDDNTFTDNGAPIVRIRRSPHYSDTGNRNHVFHNTFTIDMETGIGATSGQGAVPQIGMRYSNDAGHTWSAERFTSIGSLGGYKARVQWRRLGRARDRIYEVRISDPVKVVMIDAYLDATAGSS